MSSNLGRKVVFVRKHAENSENGTEKSCNGAKNREVSNGVGRDAGLVDNIQIDRQQKHMRDILNDELDQRMQKIGPHLGVARFELTHVLAENADVHGSANKRRYS